MANEVAAQSPVKGHKISHAGAQKRIADNERRPTDDSQRAKRNKITRADILRPSEQKDLRACFRKERTKTNIVMRYASAQ